MHGVLIFIRIFCGFSAIRFRVSWFFHVMSPVIMSYVSEFCNGHEEKRRNKTTTSCSIDDGDLNHVVLQCVNLCPFDWIISWTFST